MIVPRAVGLQEGAEGTAKTTIHGHGREWEKSI